MAFNPEENDIDAKLFDEIVDLDWLEHIRNSEGHHHKLIDSGDKTEVSDSSSSDPGLSAQDDYPEPDAVFNTNIDDFLELYNRQNSMMDESHYLVAGDDN